jgi:23S rRNA pseudouridine1911/1915/1917 synthase
MAGGWPELERRVSPSEEGQRIDVVVAAWLDQPRARIQQRLAAGDVRVDDVPVAKSHRVRAGERISLATPAPPPPPEPPPHVPVRWEDEHMAVVAKPAGLMVHAGAGHQGATLVDALKGMGMQLVETGDPDRPGIVHRLDRGTSGVLVVAKTSQAYGGLVRAFQAHDIERRYWALVEGVPDPPRATIDAPIGRSPTARTRFRVDTSGRSAVSHYDVREAFGCAAALDVRLETGRTHQVRVHLSTIGHPVAGDRAYGASPVLALQLDLCRPALHAAMLGLRHPVSGERVEVTEPLPGDLTSALWHLRRAR